jgi:hypothetical protein
MDKKLLLAIPTYKFVTSIAFSHMMGTLLDGANSGLVKSLTMEADMYVTMARNNMCRAALELEKKGEVTHLLMIDDDVLVPTGGIKKICEHEAPVVSGVYYTRDLKPVAYNFDPYKMFEDIPSSGAIECDGAGAGFLLISCELLRQMRERFNSEWWFQNTIEVDGGNEKYLGEDVFFFRSLKEMGVKCLIDCDVQCGHAGISIADRSVFDLKRGLQRGPDENLGVPINPNFVSGPS